MVVLFSLKEKKNSLLNPKPIEYNNLKSYIRELVGPCENIKIAKLEFNYFDYFRIRLIIRYYYYVILLIIVIFIIYVILIYFIFIILLFTYIHMMTRSNLIIILFFFVPYYG